jgi:5'-methylthioadenosine phosphorylase
MEGPAFSTRAESFLHRSWGVDVIGMTALPEAKLAREAEICYAVIACVTDYDCWREGHEAVTVDIIMETLRQNDDTTREIIKLAAGKTLEVRDCGCASALSTAIVTAPEVIPDEQKRKLGLLIGTYLPKGGS